MRVVHVPFWESLRPLHAHVSGRMKTPPSFQIAVKALCFGTSVPHLPESEARVSSAGQHSPAAVRWGRDCAGDCLLVVWRLVVGPVHARRAAEVGPGMVGVVGRETNGRAGIAGDVSPSLGAEGRGGEYVAVVIVGGADGRDSVAGGRGSGSGRVGGAESRAGLWLLVALRIFLLVAAEVERELGHVEDPVVRAAPGGGSRAVRTAQRRLHQERLTDVEQHVGCRSDQLLLCDGLHVRVVKHVPVSIGRVLAVGGVVAVAHAAQVVADGVEIVDVV